MLRWLVQRGIVVIPKSVRPDRMAQNLDIFDFAVSEDQLAQITTLDTGANLFFDHRDPAMVSRSADAGSTDAMPTDSPANGRCPTVPSACTS